MEGDERTKASALEGPSWSYNEILVVVVKLFKRGGGHRQPFVSLRIILLKRPLWRRLAADASSVGRKLNAKSQIRIGN